MAGAAQPAPPPTPLQHLPSHLPPQPHPPLHSPSQKQQQQQQQQLPNPSPTSDADRGWRLARVDVRLRVSMEDKILRGECELQVVELRTDVDSIRINLACCSVARVTVDATDARFELCDNTPVELGNLAQVRLDDLDNKRQAAIRQQQLGELLVWLPPAPASKSRDEIRLRVEYQTLPGSATALRFSEDNGFHAHRGPRYQIPYLFTDSRFGHARTWLPCLDSNKEADRTLFQIALTVFNHKTEGMPPFMAIASGRPTQVEQAPSSRTFFYETSAPCLAAELSFVVGPFQVLPDPNYPSKVTHFCLPTYDEPLVHTSPPVLQRVLPFFSAYFGGGTSASDPLSATRSAGIKLVYLGNKDIGSLPVSFSSGLVLLSGDLLHLPDQIEPEFHARYSIAFAIASFYFGSLVRPRTKEDGWLPLGLSLHLAALFCKTILGQNWYRFFVLDQTDKVIKSGSKGVVLNDVTGSAVFASATRHRAHLLVHMIERRAGADVFKRVLRDVVGEALSGKTLVGDTEGTTGTVGVAPLLKHVRAVCGTDLRALVKWWVNTAGIPRFQCAYRYDNKKHQVEFALKHDVVFPAGKQTRDLSTKTISVSSLTIRVMELEGPNESTVELRDTVQVTEFPCLSRRTKSKVMKSSESGGSGSVALDSQPTVSQSIPPSSGGCPILWVRVDPEMEWTKQLIFQQPQSAWISVLKGERDAPTQLAACLGLGRQPSNRGADALSDALVDKRVYYRVRMAAAKSLGLCATLSTDYVGLDRLMAYFEETYMYREGDRTYVRPNDFSDLSEYYVRLAVVEVLGTISGSPSARISNFLISLLEYNDNEMNLFSDETYLACLVRSLGHIMKQTRDGHLLERALKQFDRFENVDRVLKQRDGVLRLAVKEARAECLSSKSSFEKLEWDVFFSPVYEFQKQALKAFIDIRPVTIRELGRLLSVVDGKGLEPIFQSIRPRLKRKILRVWWNVLTSNGESLLHQLRSPSRLAVALCIRLVTYSFTPTESEESRLAREICFLIWGRGAPVCLLSDQEIEQWHKKIQEHAALQAAQVSEKAKEVNVSGGPVGAPGVVPLGMPIKVPNAVPIAAPSAVPIEEPMAGPITSPVAIPVMPLKEVRKFVPEPASISLPELPEVKPTAQDAVIAMAVTAAARDADSPQLERAKIDAEDFDSEDLRYLRLAFTMRSKKGVDGKPGSHKKTKKKKRRTGSDGKVIDEGEKKKKKKKKRREGSDSKDGRSSGGSGLKIKIKLPVASPTE